MSWVQFLSFLLDLNKKRLTPVINFCNFFLIVKKSPKIKNDINNIIKICFILIFRIDDIETNKGL